MVLRPCLYTTRMHSHETRQKNYIHIAGTRTTSAKQCIRQYIPTVLTSIPTLVSDKITTHSYAGFSRYAKQYFIQLYKYECVISNCYTALVYVLMQRRATSGPRARSGPRRSCVRPATLFGNNMAIRPAKPQTKNAGFMRKMYESRCKLRRSLIKYSN